MAAERVVNLSEIAPKRIEERFTAGREIANPCGVFPATLSFGATGQTLRAACLADRRRETQDQFGRYRGLVSPPDGGSWRVAFDLSTGEELARLESFYPCSPELDRVETAIAGGEAVYSCRLSRDDHRQTWRAVSVDGGVRGTTSEAEFRTIAVGRHLFRQAGVGPVGGWIPNPEIMLALGREGHWSQIVLPADLDCASLTNPTIDGARALMTAGRLETIEASEGATYQRCVNETSLAYDPETSEWSRFPLDGAFGSVDRTTRVFVDRDRGGGWTADDQLFYVAESSGQVATAFKPGERLSMHRYMRLNTLEGEGLLAIEAISKNASERFSYFVFDWAGNVLAAFEADAIALAPDRARMVVVTGDDIRVWDLRDEAH